MRIGMKARSAISLTISYIIILIFVLFTIIPIVYIVGVSFNTDSSLYSNTIFPTHPTLANYTALLTKTDFPRWYLNTIIVGCLSGVLSICLVAPTAYSISRLRFPGRKQMLITILVLQMFPGMMAMVAYYVLLNLIGLLDTHIGLVLLYAGAGIPGYTWMLKGYFDTIPKALEEAALIDGANRFQTLTKIILPLAAPMLTLIGVFSFAAPFGDYVLSRIVLTSPKNYTLALGTFTFVAAQYSKNFSEFAASSLLASLPISILYLSLQKTMFSGIKGSMVR